MQENTLQFDLLQSNGFPFRSVSSALSEINNLDVLGQ